MQFTKYKKQCRRKKTSKTRKNNKRKGGDPKQTVEALMRDNITNKTFGLEKYLQRVCPSSGYCLGFGKETQNIKDYFNGFDKFDYLHSIKLLSAGASGIVDLLTFVRGKYYASTIFKMAKKAEADNLFFEAYIGYNYINKQNKYFPCFIETYGAYKFVSSQFKTLLSSEQNIENYSTNKPANIPLNKPFKDPMFLKQIPIPTPDNLAPTFNNLDKPSFIEASCQRPENNAILIQTIDKGQTFWDLLVKYLKLQNSLPEVYSSNLRNIMQLLLQVYAPLSMLQDEFTHFDLHEKNVLIYTIPNNKMITLNYYDANDNLEISFNTQFIAKIADYGRCYTPLNNEYFNRVLKTASCKKVAYDTKKRQTVISTAEKGYNWFVQNQESWNFYISQLLPNQSHDLILASRVIEHVRTTKAYRKLMANMLDNIYYEDTYGTPSTSSQNNSTSSTPKILNVTDMYKALVYTVKTLPQPTPPPISSISGSLNIYLSRNKEMQFIPASQPKLQTPTQAVHISPAPPIDV